LLDLSAKGCRIELSQEIALPQFFVLSPANDWNNRRLCAKIWQIEARLGARFIEKQ
jgi:hypothetical protein